MNTVDLKTTVQAHWFFSINFKMVLLSKKFIFYFCCSSMKQGVVHMKKLLYEICYADLGVHRGTKPKTTWRRWFEFACNGTVVQFAWMWKQLELRCALDQKVKLHAHAFWLMTTSLVQQNACKGWQCWWFTLDMSNSERAV